MIQKILLFYHLGTNSAMPSVLNSAAAISRKSHIIQSAVGISNKDI